MKRLISMALVAAMALTMGACSAKKETATDVTLSGEAVETTVAGEAAKGQNEDVKESAEIDRVGVLTMLNMTESEMSQYRKAYITASRALKDEGYFKRPNLSGNKLNEESEIVFYDTLDSMLMALNSDHIDDMIIYYRTAQYLCANDNNLVLLYSFDFEKERNTFAELMLSGHLSNDFSFLMMEGKEDLRDEFSSVINDMKEDGTMDKLVKEQIYDIVYGAQFNPVAMPEIAGAETIKVAVTGALPPMDYVAADGTPAGFNTAVLAEISQRIGKNIELVVVDSIGRATALSSGTVDAVFWTRTNEMAAHYAEMSEEEKEAEMKKYEAEMNDEEIEAFNKIREILNFENYNSADMPEGTICTVPYYSDILVPVKKKS